MVAQRNSRSSEAALKIRISNRSVRVDAAAIGLEQAAIQVVGESRVGRGIRQVEEGMAGAGVFPVDQPEPLAVVDQVGWQQIVVAQDGPKRRDPPRQPARILEQFANILGQAGLQPRGCLSIGADGLERAEIQDFAGQDVPRAVQMSQQGRQLAPTAGSRRSAG